MSTTVRDLICLAADRNTENALTGLFSRPAALGIRPIQYDIFVHPERDPGCLSRSHDLLRSHSGRYAYAIVVFDREGCGRDARPSSELETRVERALRGSGWADRAAAIVIDPELEAWVWSDSPHVATELGWREQPEQLRAWLQEQGLHQASGDKPLRPKEAVEEALRKARKQRSSAMYRNLAEKVSLARCKDPSFARLLDVLRTWFALT